MRRRDIDWLRIFAIFLLFPFHAARVFDYREANYILSDASSSAGVTFMSVIWPWFMPLLFFVAGVSTWYALQKKDARHYLKERVLRLLIPLVLGIILIVPIQGYMARMRQGTLTGGYFHYLFAQFFPDFSDISGYNGTFTPAHLWFILYLFAISCLLLPLFMRVVSARRQQNTGALGRLFEKGWFLLLLFIPLTVSEGLPDIGGKNPFFFGMYYTIGFFIASTNAFKTIDSIKWWSFGITLLSIPLYMLLGGIASGYDDFAWQSILLALVRNLYGISAILTMLAFSQKYLNRGGRVLSYLNQAAFPVYILHQSVMMVIAYYVVQWRGGITLQFAAIMLLTLAACMVLFEAFRHIAPMRFILGIKAAKGRPVRTGSPS